MAAPTPGEIFGVKGRASGAAKSPGEIFGAPAGGTPGLALAAPAHHGGGIFGDLKSAAHFVAAKTELAGHDLKSIPGGIADVGKAVAHDTAQRYEHPLTVQHHPETLPLVEGMAKGSATAVAHPLRDPFQTITTLAPIFRFAGEVGLRGSAVADAVKAGGGPKGAVKAAATRPPIRPRLIRQGDAQTPLVPSKNPAVRIVQHAYDHVIQKALDTNPEGRVAAHAAKRVGGSLAETGRYRQRMREVPAALVERGGQKLAPAKLNPLRAVSGKPPRKVQEAALRLTSENSTAEEAAAAHTRWAAAGQQLQAKAAAGAKLTDDEKQLAAAVKDNQRQANLAGLVAKHGLLTHDEHGDVVVDAAAHPDLAALDAQVAHGQDQVDQIAIKHGLLTEEAAAERRNGPARIRNGATFERPTPGKAGKPSQSLLRQRAQVARLQTVHDRVVTSAVKDAEETAAKMEPPPSTGEIAGKRARLANLESAHDTALSTIARGMFGKADMSETRFRNTENAKAARQASGVTKNGRASGASGFKSTVRPTVIDENLAKAEQAVEDAIARNPNDPTLAKWRARTNEIDKLRAALNVEPGEKITRAGLGKEPVAAAVGTKVVSSAGVRAASGSARAERIGAALSVAKDRLEQMEQAAANRVKPTGVIGGTPAREGRGFVSYRTQEPRAAKSAAASSGGPVVGQPKSFIPKQPIEYKNLQHGRIPDNTTRLVARHMRDAYKYVNTGEFRDTAYKTGADAKRSSRDVLVRNPYATAEQLAKEHGITLREAQQRMKIGPALDEELGRKASTLDELPPEELDAVRHGFDAWRQHLVPGLLDNFARDKAQPIGAAAPLGARWVDRNVLGDLGKPGPGPRSALGAFADKTNTAITSATVYFKLGHVGTRYFTNAATNIIQGSATAKQIGWSSDLWHALTVEERAKALAAAGQHSFHALPLTDETGAISKGISAAGRAGASWWARHADAPFRFNSLAYEARKAGFDTPEKFKLLLDQLENPHAHNLNAAQAAKVDWVAKRANREAIAYDRLSDFERRYITRAFWFYPWTAAATRFAVNTLLEHPFKTAALGALAAEGRQTQQRELGDLPSYEQGLVKLGGGADHPLTSDFSTFSPFATPGDILQLPEVGTVSSYLNPAYAAVGELAQRQDQYGQHTNNPVGDALSSLFSPTPEAQIVSAYLGRHQDQSKRMFHKTWRNQLARALAGPAVPRPVNVAALHSAAARERAGR